MASSYTQAALVSQTTANAQASQQPAPPPPVTVLEKIPPSMAKYMDVEAEIPVTKVQVDGMVLMKIIKHGKEASGNAAGLLLGLDLDGTLEISNSFPLPLSSEGEDKVLRTSGGRYESTLLRMLKEAQYDDSIVGFYQSIPLGAFLRQSLISTQASHHDTLRQGGIALVHDSAFASRGSASLKAFRLTKSFLAAHKVGTFNSQSLIDHKLTFASVLEELPLSIRSSPLLTAFLSSLASEASQSVTPSIISPSISTKAPSLLPSFEHMDNLAPGTLAKPMEALLDTLDAYKTEENNVSFHIRQIAREKARQEAYIAKRKEENDLRIEEGLPPLPEEDMSRLFKFPPDPNRLEVMLLLGQVDGYARSLEDVSASAMLKLYAAQP
ncbi:uncharacterized protein EI90DRAFT_2972613 [Cantharellus anzutake]|uniref:uncharacterized protein n=1 Tax=Cantharellus anzutake TaxID=1750568 RepID=UPI00190895E7|nr:uncharacterized protein EI90DRAFT_2972613 [Cantharellus anzutake]KAF8331497.1 hypothetical protein EI90DRAFT_2972613 [Cantharellus anzutake]